MRSAILALTVFFAFWSFSAAEVKESKGLMEMLGLRRAKRQCNNNSGGSSSITDLLPLLMMTMQMNRAQAAPPMYMPPPAQPQIITVTVPVPSYALRGRNSKGKNAGIKPKSTSTVTDRPVGQQIHKSNGGSKLTNFGINIFPQSGGNIISAAKAKARSGDAQSVPVPTSSVPKPPSGNKVKPDDVCSKTGDCVPGAVCKVSFTQSNSGRYTCQCTPPLVSSGGRCRSSLG